MDLSSRAVGDLSNERLPEFSARGMVSSLYPLQYVTLPAILSYSIETVNRAFLGLLLPADSNDALAIFVSEGVSGF